MINSYTKIVDLLLCFISKQEEFECWKEIKGYDGKYLISNNGNVLSLNNNKCLIRQPHKNKDGYLQITLSHNGNKETKLIHKLVAESFLINDDETKTEIHHKDFNKLNNSVLNLQWVSRAEHNKIHINARKAQKNG